MVQALKATSRGHRYLTPYIYERAPNQPLLEANYHSDARSREPHAAHDRPAVDWPPRNVSSGTV